MTSNDLGATLGALMSKRMMQDAIRMAALRSGWAKTGKIPATNGDAGQCVNTPGAAPKGLVSMQEKSTPTKSKFVRTTAGQVETKCAACGRTLFVAPSRLRYFSAVYCNRACHAAHVRPLEDRFWEKVKEVSSGCWEWQGFKDRAGYGRIRVGGRTGESGYAHRVSYEMYVGAIPEGFHLDHLCRNRKCVNPAHLEAVTPAENLRRGDMPSMKLNRSGKCSRGHEWTEENTYFPPGRPGARQCRACNRQRKGSGE